MNVGIVGYGHVGKAMHRLFPDAAIYDKFDVMHNGRLIPFTIDSDGYREQVNACDVAFVCVPTPSLPDGSCDVSIVEEVVGWLTTPLICIKSTVPPGTTDRLQRATGQGITMSPEFEGETAWQNGADDWPYVIVGGLPEDAQAVLDVFRSRLGPAKSYWATTAKTAELAKYMENVWLAMQVTWANEFYEIAQAVGVDYGTARELWALDPRVSRWHTLVFPEARGFDGKCLPKDLRGIIAAANEAGYAPTFLEAIRDANSRFAAAPAVADGVPA